MFYRQQSVSHREGQLHFHFRKCRVICVSDLLHRPEARYSDGRKKHHLVNKEQFKTMKSDFPDSFLFGLIGKTNRSKKKDVRISRWEAVRKDFLE